MWMNALKTQSTSLARIPQVQFKLWDSVTAILYAQLFCIEPCWSIYANTSERAHSKNRTILSWWGREDHILKQYCSKYINRNSAWDKSQLKVYKYTIRGFCFVFCKSSCFLNNTTFKKRIVDSLPVICHLKDWLSTCKAIHPKIRKEHLSMLIKDIKINIGKQFLHIISPTVTCTRSHFWISLQTVQSLPTDIAWMFWF